MLKTIENLINSYNDYEEIKKKEVEKLEKEIESLELKNNDINKKLNVNNLDKSNYLKLDNEFQKNKNKLISLGKYKDKVKNKDKFDFFKYYNPMLEEIKVTQNKYKEEMRKVFDIIIKLEKQYQEDFGDSYMNLVYIPDYVFGSHQIQVNYERDFKDIDPMNYIRYFLKSNKYSEYKEKGDF